MIHDSFLYLLLTPHLLRHDSIQGPHHRTINRRQDENGHLEEGDTKLQQHSSQE